MTLTPNNSINQKDIRQLDEAQIIALFSQLGEPAFRAKQVHQWIWQKFAYSFDEMTNLPKNLREKLNAAFTFKTITTDSEQKSEDGTLKFGFRVFDGNLIEGVLIPKGKRMTACISSQVGCSLSCKFCATGQMARVRNLDFFEIYDQVVLIHKAALLHYDTPLTNIVYMGMGEPLLNYNNVKLSIEKICAPEGLGMSPRRITLSTVGIAKMIVKLADDLPKVNLAVSLHAANNVKRKTIMPINDSNDIEAIKVALLYWHNKTQKLVTQEYVMLSGFNDDIEDAANLAAFCKAIPSKINLIEYNPIDGGVYERSSNNRAMTFKAELEKRGLIANIRRSRGKDIDAACGQLANKSKE